MDPSFIVFSFKFPNSFWGGQKPWFSSKHLEIWKESAVLYRPFKCVHNHTSVPQPLCLHHIFPPFAQELLLFFVVLRFRYRKMYCFSYNNTSSLPFFLPVGRGHCNEKGPPSRAPRAEVSRSAEDPCVGPPNTEAAPTLSGVRRRRPLIGLLRAASTALFGLWNLIEQRLYLVKCSVSSD